VKEIVLPQREKWKYPEEGAVKLFTHLKLTPKDLKELTVEIKGDRQTFVDYVK